MSLLDDLFRTGQLRALDHALAQRLRRLDPETPELVLAGAALASLAVAQGHAAFDPARPGVLVDAAQIAGWPPAGDWQHALSMSRWVAVARGEACSDPSRPLVLEQGLLYLRRYRQYEQRLADGMRKLAAAADDSTDASVTAPLLSLLFPDAADNDSGSDPGQGLQARAAALALRKPLLLVTGGPGTGKTTTIVRILLLLVARAATDDGAPPRIALAAPTGRAADRMRGSVQRGLERLRALPGVDPALCDALPTQAQTLHRLLGTIPGSTRFRHDVDNPLPFDIVVVDEASMVDLPLMCKLVEAVADGARLILLGDRDQLPSVEAGDVLAAIGDAAGDDDGDGPIAADAGVLTGHRVHLTRGYRQSSELDLAPLVEAVRIGDADAAVAQLRDGVRAGVVWHQDLADPLEPATRERLLAPWRALQACSDPREALALVAHARLLTAVREGPQGAQLLNARIEEALAGTQRTTYFPGRLLMVTENSYRHGLFNGDLGVCLPAPEGIDGIAPGQPLVWFEHGAQPRWFPPSTLPQHDTAFATTVHKAQGSEFDSAWLLLPARDNRVLSRELLYTALTRARHQVHVCGSAQILHAAIGRHVLRVSGLRARLQFA